MASGFENLFAGSFRLTSKKGEKSRPRCLNISTRQGLVFPSFAFTTFWRHQWSINEHTRYPWIYMLNKVKRKRLGDLIWSPKGQFGFDLLSNESEPRWQNDKLSLWASIIVKEKLQCYFKIALYKGDGYVWKHLRKQPKFCDLPGFPAKWSVRNDCRHFILIPSQDLGSASDWF